MKKIINYYGKIQDNYIENLEQKVDIIREAGFQVELKRNGIRNGFCMFSMIVVVEDKDEKKFSDLNLLMPYNQISLKID